MPKENETFPANLNLLSEKRDKAVIALWAAIHDLYTEIEGHAELSCEDATLWCEITRHSALQRFLKGGHGEN